MFKSALVGAAMLAGMTAAANATVSGTVAGPDNSFAIIFNFANDGPEDILGITVDMSTTALNLVFGGSVPPTGTADAPSTVTNMHTVAMTWLIGGFVAGEDIGFSADPDTISDESFGAIVSDLLNTLVTVNFAGGGTFVGKFVDDPAPGAGLTLAPTSAVPVPAALPLLATALGALGFAGWRRAGKAA
jgi:hypothetical protein